MIPDFDEFGQLPPGVFQADLDEVLSRFVERRSLKRVELGISLRKFVRLIRDYAIRVYIDGSFVTAKLSPSDIDLIVLLTPDFYSTADNRTLSDFRRFLLSKPSYGLHIFSYTSEQDEHFKEMVDWFTKDRQGNRKGIVCLEVEND